MKTTLLRAVSALAILVLICGLISCGSSSSSSSPTPTPTPTTTPTPTQDPTASVSISPNTGATGSTVTVAITGNKTNFVQGSTTASFGPGTSIAGAADAAFANVTVSSATSATVSVTISSSAAPGPRYIVVTTAGHNSTATFFVTSSSPVATANAGPNQLVTVGNTVHLDGSASTSPTGAPLTYTFTFLSTPSGSSAALVNPASCSANSCVNPTFTADKAGDYIVKLTVSDGNTTTSAAVLVSTVLVPPLAADPNQLVSVGSTVQLDASPSTDTSLNPLTYSWTLSPPKGSAATLSDAGSVTPTFTADVAGDYVAQVTTNDGKGNNSTAMVTISTNQIAPTANAGPNQVATVSNKVQLDGSASSAPNSDQLNFSWSVISSPASSAVSSSTLTGRFSANPSFTPDVAGVYVVQLIVTDTATNVNSAPATVEISTDDVPPVANAGSRQFVAPGATVQLDGSKSDAAKGSLSSYSWVLLTKPSGSSASLSSTSIPNPTFTADVAGNYVAQLIVSDSILTSVPNTVLIVATTGVLTLSPTSIDCGSAFVGTTANCSQSLTLTNTGTGDLLVKDFQLTGNNASDFHFTKPDSLPGKLAAGASATINFTFSPSTAASESASFVIDDTAPGSPHTVALTGTGKATTISASPLSLNFPDTLLGNSSTATVTVSNTGASSLTISALSITGGQPSDFSVSPAAPITVNAGSSATLTVTFKPGDTGPRKATLDITNSVTGNNPLTVQLSGNGRSNANIIIPPALQNLSLGGNLEVLATASLQVPAPSNLTVTITSGDPTKLLVSTSATTAGSASVQLSVAAGQGTQGIGGFYIQALASSGVVAVTISGSGYNPGTANVTLTPSGFVLNSPNGQGQDFTTATGAPPSPLTVSAAQLDSKLNFVSKGTVRGGSDVSIPIVSGTPATGTISGTPTVAGGTNSSTNAVTFNPVASGTSVLSITQPAGYSTPAAGASVKATVSAPTISVNPVTVGANLAVQGSVFLQVAPPQAGTSVTITSPDPKVLLSTDLTGKTAGTNKITYTATTQVSKFIVQGVAVTSSPVTLTTQAVGYTDTTSQVAVTPAGFVITTPSGNSFSTTTISTNTTLTVTPWRLDPSNNQQAPGQIRGGLTVTVPLLSATPSTGTIVGSPLTFTGGDTSNSTASFKPNPNASGTVTSVLSVDVANISVAGFSAANGGTVTATVTQPAITIAAANTTIGKNLQLQASGSLNANVPAPNPLNVTITTSPANPNVLFSTDPTKKGTASITIQVQPNNGLNGSGFPAFYVQSTTDTGNATIQATATGWKTGTLGVSFAPAGLALLSSGGPGANFSASIGACQKFLNCPQLTVQSYQLDSSGNIATPEAVMGGAAVAFAITQTPTIGTITGTQSIAAGGSSATLTFTPQSQGSTTITVTEPAGFVVPKSNGTAVNTVTGTVGP